MINKVSHHIVGPKTRHLNCFPKKKKKEKNKGNYLDLGIVWIIQLSWFVDFLLHMTVDPINHKRANPRPFENRILFIVGISTVRHHGDRGLYLDLGEIHLRKDKGHLFAEVLKTIVVLDPQLVKVRLGQLEFNNGIGLYLVYLLTKGLQLCHQIGVLFF